MPSCLEICFGSFQSVRNDQGSVWTPAPFRFRWGIGDGEARAGGVGAMSLGESGSD